MSGKYSGKGMSLLICVCMFIMLLAGCSNQKNDSNSTTDTADAGLKSSESDNGETSKDIEIIRLYTPFSGNNEDKELVLEAINEISRAEIGVEIQWEQFDFGQWFQQYSLFLSGTEDVDILVSYGNFASVIAQGAAMDITELVEAYGQDISGTLGEYMKCAELDGSLYGVIPYSTFSNTMGMLYRKDIVRELGLEAQVAQVKTLADWDDILAAVKENYTDMTPYVTMSGNTMNNFNYATWDDLGDNYGVLMNGGNTTDIINLYETEEYLEMCRVMRDWYLKGYCSQDILTQTDGFTVLTQNDAAFSSLSNANFNAEFYNSTATGKDIGMVILGEEFAKTYNNLTYFVMSNSKHGEAAVKFLNLWYSNDEISSLMSYGIEGTHYQVGADGMADYIDGEDLSSCRYHSMAGSSINNAIGIKWNSSMPGYAEALIESNTETKKSKALGFTFDASNVTNEITELDNICNKYRDALECGVLDPDEVLPVFIQELKAAGIENVIAEKSSQLESWLARQR